MSLLGFIKKANDVANSKAQITLGGAKSLGQQALGIGGLVAKGGNIVQSGLSKGIGAVTGSKGFGMGDTTRGGVPTSVSTAINKVLTPTNNLQQIGKTGTDVASLVAGVTGVAKGGYGVYKLLTAPKTLTTADRLLQMTTAADNVGIGRPGTNYTITPPASAPKGQGYSSTVPPKSGQTLPGDPVGEVRGASTLDLRGTSQKPAGTTLDMRAGSKSTPTTKLETKTTAARTKGDIDTRITPTSKGTTKTKTPATPTPNGTVKNGIPWTKIGVGVAGAGLGYNAYDAMTGGGEGAPGANQSMMPADALAGYLGQASQTGQDNAAVGGEFDPNVVFDAGGSAVQSGTQYGTGGSVNSISPLATLASGGASGGYGASPASPLNAALNASFGSARDKGGMETEEDERKKKKPSYFAENYDAREGGNMDEGQAKWHAQYQQKAIERANREKAAAEERAYMSKFGPSKEERNLAQQEQNLTKQIAQMTADYAQKEAAIEGSAVSEAGRNANRTMLDREKQAQLGALMDSLGLIQTARQNASAMRDKNLQAQTAYQESLQTDAEKTPTSIQEYEYAVQNGYTGSFNDFQNQRAPQSAPASIQEYQYAQQQGYPGTYTDFKQMMQQDAQLPNSVREYEYAQQQGYQGTYDQFKNESGAGGELTATQKGRADAVNSVMAQLQSYRNLIEQTVGISGANLTGDDAARLRTAKSALEFAIAQAVGTGALQAPDRAVVQDLIPDPTSLRGAVGSLARGQKQGQLAALDEALKVFQTIQNSIGSTQGGYGGQQSYGGGGGAYNF